MQTVIGIIDNTLDDKNSAGWKGVQPAGAEGDDVMKLMETIQKLIYQSLVRHMRRRDVSPSNAFVSALGNNIGRLTLSSDRWRFTCLYQSV